MKIRTRLIVSTSIATFAVLACFTAITSLTRHAEENERFAQKLEFHRKMIPELFGVPLWNYDRPSVRAAAEGIEIDADIARLSVTNERGETFYRLSKEGVSADAVVVVPIEHGGRAVGRAELAYTRSNLERTLGEGLAETAILAASLTAVLGVLLSAIAFSITRPLYKIVEAVIAIGKGDFDRPVGVRAHGELGDLVGAIDAMGGELRHREAELRSVAEESVRNEMKYRLEAEKLEIERKERLISDGLRAELEASLASLKLAQDQIVLSEKTAMLGKLVAGVAHEINTPLGVGLTAATYLSDLVASFSKGRAASDEGELGEFVEGIRESSAVLANNLRRASDVVANFKRVSVDQISEQARTIDLREYLEDILRSLGSQIAGSGHAVELECPQGLEIRTYPGAISLIVGNLIMNSLSHAFEGASRGVMSVRAALEDDGTVSIDYADNGRGVPPERLPYLFDPFSKSVRDFGGSGLGTFVVYNTVTQKLLGTIEAASELGRGLRYSIRFKADRVGYPMGES
jgi:signal transduction histidine kinase